MPENPYEPQMGEIKQASGGLWPQSRNRRERAVNATIKAWFIFGLRAVLFAVVVGLLVLMGKVIDKNP